MALERDPAAIASAVLMAADDRLFFPGHDGMDGERRSTSGSTQPGAGSRPDILPAIGGMDRAEAGVDQGLVFAEVDGVHGIALWTSDGTEAGTRCIRRIGPSGDRTHADPAPARRTLSSILDDRRDVERRLEDAHAADDAAEVTRLGLEAASYADEYREAFESALDQYADRDIERLPRSQRTESPLAVCFPRDDPGFAERVETLLDGSHPEGPFATAVQALLRETYPLAVISPRHGLAAPDGRRVWYALRDGSVVPAVDEATS